MAREEGLTDADFVEETGPVECVELTRRQILDADDTTIEPVRVDEWYGGKPARVFVRAINTGERNRFEASCMKGKGKNRQFSHKEVREKLVVLATCDAQGDAIFAASDIDRLSRKAAAPMDRLFAAAQRLAGMSDDDIEDLAGNSGTTEGDDY